jgi:hypothetical protein
MIEAAYRTVSSAPAADAATERTPIVQNPDEALADIRLEHAQDILAEPAHGLTEQSWRKAMAELESAGRSVVPRLPPPDETTRVLTYPPATTFGALLDAAARFLADGGRENADRTARAARAVKALTVIPGQRYHRQETPPPGSTAAQLLTHRIRTEGNGFLALPAGEVLEATGPRGKRREILGVLEPSDPAAYVVVWEDLTAPGIILSGVKDAYHHGSTGAAELHRHLVTAAQGLVPGAAHDEW